MVVVDVPFQVTVGLQQRRDTRLVGTAALELVKGEAVELEVVLLHDPTSIVGLLEAAGLVDVEWYVRGPVTARGETTKRLYVIGRRAG